MFTIQPPLSIATLSGLRPTQITVGYSEVERKQKKWAALKPSERKKKMREELFPVVMGPHKRLYIIDHHHTALAMLRESDGDVQVGLVKDLSDLSEASFWIFLDHNSWCHPYDARGHRTSFRAIPSELGELHDDPFRSFAADVRESGGYAKPMEPFLEFLWANFFRNQLSRKLLEKHPRKAIEKALKLAKSPGAQHLPGWSGEK